MTQGERIKYYREKANLTLEDLGKKVDTTAQTIFKYENDVITNIPYDRILKLSKALQIQPWIILGWEPPQDQKATLYKANDLTLTIPFISPKVSPGRCVDNLSDDDISVKTIEIAATLARGVVDKSTLVAAEVIGDSMINANIYPGDIVVFSKGLIQAEGIYVVSFAGDVLVKRIEFDRLENKISIISENPKYQTRTIYADNDSFQILGKVLGWIHYEY